MSQKTDLSYILTLSKDLAVYSYI